MPSVDHLAISYIYHFFRFKIRFKVRFRVSIRVNYSMADVNSWDQLDIFMINVFVVARHMNRANPTSPSAQATTRGLVRRLHMGHGGFGTSPIQ